VERGDVAPQVERIPFVLTTCPKGQHKQRVPFLKLPSRKNEGLAGGSEKAISIREHSCFVAAALPRNFAIF